MGWYRLFATKRASLATPTTSNSRLAPARVPKCLPIGSSSLKNFRANASLMTATFRAPEPSCSKMPRPLMIGLPMTSKNPAVTRSHEAELSSIGPGAACPSTHTPAPQPPRSGEYVQRATEDTPGNARYGIVETPIERRELPCPIASKAGIDTRHNASILVKSEILVL